MLSWVLEGEMVRRISFQDTTVFTAMSQPGFECDFAFETNETSGQFQLTIHKAETLGLEWNSCFSIQSHDR